MKQEKSVQVHFGDVRCANAVSNVTFAHFHRSQRSYVYLESSTFLVRSITTDFLHSSFQMDQSSNLTAVVPTMPSPLRRSMLAVVLGAEMLLGVLGNALVLLTKFKARGQFKCQCWLPLASLSVSDLGSSLFVISSSLLAVLTSGQQSPWCELVSLLKFAFITSSLGSLGVVFGSVPVAYKWIRYDPAEMLCAVFWESSYSDMLAYVVCAFAICIFPPLLVLLGFPLASAGCARNDPRRDPGDLSSVTPLLVTCYLLCYTPFALSELALLGRRDLSPVPAWLRTLSSLTAYLDCGLNPLIYCTNREFRGAVFGLLWTGAGASPEPVLTALARRDV
ncbi:Visual pigment-like receptor peropsin-like [Scleropages formosus]|uniref:Visual pigment-like receptor peropsin-like n=1 Tax=Scleropages formosus TaxID=113540 RepID=A0A0P7ULF2_SCLFO|nr:Visual pigment-like receptor peropsin-like [Scleropages formosus]